MAAGVELRTGVRVGSVESDELMTDYIVAGLQARGDGVLDTGVTRTHEGRNSPGVRGALTTTFLNLEPNLLSSRKPVVAPAVGASGHVCDDGTNVRVGPQGPLESDGRSGGSRGVERSRGRSDDASGAVSAALKINRVEVLDGAVAGDGSGNTLGRRVHVRVHVRLVEGVALATNGGGIDVAVGGDHGRGEQDGHDGLHDGEDLSGKRREGKRRMLPTPG